MWWIFSLAALCCAPFLAVLLYAEPDNITKSTCDRINGMTVDQICAILGPPNDSRQLPSPGGAECGDVVPGWQGKIGRIHVSFGFSGVSTVWEPSGADGQLPRDEHAVGLD